MTRNAHGPPFEVHPPWCPRDSSDRPTSADFMRKRDTRRVWYRHTCSEPATHPRKEVSTNARLCLELIPRRSSRALFVITPPDEFCETPREDVQEVDRCR